MPTEVTIIPEETQPGDRSRIEERVEEAGRQTVESTGRLAAAIVGALEGFVEALDRYDVGNESRRAIHNAGEITRAGAVEAKEQAATPEMQQLGEQARRAGEYVGDRTHAATDAMRSSAQDMRNNVHEVVESAKFAAVRAKEEVKVRAEAVAETGRRARLAPGHIGHEIGEAYVAWKRALVTSIAMFATLAVFGLVALVVLTIALVVGLNEMIGDPAGTFVVALLYVIVAGIAWAVSRAARVRAALEREERMENIREEVRHVVRPVRDAFSRGRPGY